MTNPDLIDCPFCTQRIGNHVTNINVIKTNNINFCHCNVCSRDFKIKCILVKNDN